MAGIKLQKRGYDFFISYGHSDAGCIIELVDLLKRLCGLKIWIDNSSGNASSRSSELLGNAIGNARGVLFCLSETWKSSSWCKDEYDVSLAERRMNEGFEIVTLRLDDVEAPQWFNLSEIIDLRQITAKSVARLLCSLNSSIPRRYDNAEDVYLAAPWSRISTLVRVAFEALQKPGWRLIGDSPNLTYLGANRIQAIISTTRGMVAVLPCDPSQPEGTSPYIIEEARLAKACGKPLLLLREPGVSPSEDLARYAFRGMGFELGEASDSKPQLAAFLEDFDDRLHATEHDDTNAYIFYAGSLRVDPSESDEITSVIECASNMRCIRGERLQGDNVQKAIINLIRRAAVIIADVSDGNRNTLIDAGIAMGSDTPLKLISRAPPAGQTFKKRFMFEGQEVLWHQTEKEQLCLIYFLARQFRRRVYFTP
jgi:hypothetical protein